jgi:signal transduction histidine kinase
MKVLVVDSDEGARTETSEALTELTNVVVVAVADVRNALRVLDEGRTDVVVTGCDLPDGDCIDVIDAVRQRDPRPAVVVFPVDDNPERSRRCLAAGADLYLPRGAGRLELQSGLLDVAAGRRSGARLLNDDRFKLVGRLASGVAHDLNNHLAVISMALEMLDRRADSAAMRAEILLGRRAMEGASELTSSLLQYVRGTAPPVRAVDLGALVRRVVDRFASAIPIPVVVVVEVDDPLPAVRGAAGELEQLVLNLVMNACDAMPEGGQLHLSVRRDEARTVRLEVTDTGGGADVDLEVGGATSRSAKREPGSRGLGLGIVRAVVDRHGGSLRIVPHAGGCRVGVVLPAWVGDA